MAAGPGPEEGTLGHKWIAICTMTMAATPLARVEAMHAYQQHMAFAFESGRGDFDPTLHFMMGMFRVAILATSPLQRRAAQIIYGNALPGVTHEDAISSFELAGSLRPGGKPFAMDLVEIAKCHRAVGRFAEAE